MVARNEEGTVELEASTVVWYAIGTVAASIVVVLFMGALAFGALRELKITSEALADTRQAAGMCRDALIDNLARRQQLEALLGVAKAHDAELTRAGGN